MNDPDSVSFLTAFAHAVHKNEEELPPLPDYDDWVQILELARQQNILPMIAAVVLSCPSARRSDPAVRSGWQRLAMQELSLQLRRTQEFLALLKEFRNAGLDPVVVKGIVCRRLYPEPDARPSSDEDLVIEGEKWAAYDAVLQKCGFHIMNTESPADIFEISYSSPGSPLHLELHKTLFPADSEAFGIFNRFFTDLRERRVSDGGFSVPCATDHFLYLVLHAFKHFLHSGFSLRQVCDISLFAQAYGSEIDWNYIWESCQECRCDDFASALLWIGREQLQIDLPMDRFPGMFADRIRSPDAALRIGEKRIGLLAHYRISERREQCIRITGSSMAPFLCHQRDFAYYVVPDRRLRKGDIIFYRRDDGRKVLHRIVRVHEKAHEYDLIGDGQTEIESGIRQDQVFGLVTHVTRKGRPLGPGSFWWWWFGTVWIRMIPLRKFLK